MVGTPTYMAPEQCAGQEAGPPADIYALGVIAFEMITGRVPFNAPTPLGVIAAHQMTPPPSPRKLNPSLPESVVQPILTCLAKDPRQRPETATEFVEQLAIAVAASATQYPLTPPPMIPQSAAPSGMQPPMTPSPSYPATPTYVAPMTPAPAPTYTPPPPTPSPYAPAAYAAPQAPVATPPPAYGAYTPMPAWGNTTAACAQERSGLVGVDSPVGRRRVRRRDDHHGRGHRNRRQRAGDVGSRPLAARRNRRGASHIAVSCGGAGPRRARSLGTGDGVDIGRGPRHHSRRRASGRGGRMGTVAGEGPARRHAAAAGLRHAPWQRGDRRRADAAGRVVHLRLGLDTQRRHHQRELDPLHDPAGGHGPGVQRGWQRGARTSRSPQTRSSSTAAPSPRSPAPSFRAAGTSTRAWTAGGATIAVRTDGCHFDAPAYNVEGYVKSASTLDAGPLLLVADFVPPAAAGELDSCSGATATA